MKFEAEIIKEIVDSRGHEKASIHYQSECVEEWLKEVEGAYPKLCDYQPEWLNYSAENKIGVFPYTTLTDATHATLENVVPYAYKRAILSGNTLVNLSPFTNKIALSPSNISETKKVLQPLNQNTKYILIFNINNSTSSLASNYITVRGYNTDGAFKEYGRTIKNFGNGRHYILLESTEGNVERIFIGSNFSCEIDDTILTIYQDGMENWDIPYFTGMQSVKLPVVTTMGKNLFDGELEVGYYNINNGAKVNSGTRVRSANYIKISPNRQIIINGSKSSSKSFYKIFYDRNKNFIDASTSEEVVTTPENAQYMTFYSIDINASIDELIQIEYGTQATSYEPYKSNILTVNEPVELRGIGDVKDTLDCLTGEVTERIGEVVFDGSDDEVWNLWATYPEESAIFKISKTNALKIMIPFKNGQMVCDKFPTVSRKSLINIGATYPHAISFFGSEGEYIQLRVYKSLLKSVDVDGLRDYLANEPITVQYPLADESIKTVDLSVVDQGGKSLERIKPIEGTMHLNTSGETINPLFSGEIPVEAITQNLASFVEE